MHPTTPTRRGLLAGAAAALALAAGRPGAAAAPIELEWDQLIPAGEGTDYDRMKSVLGIIEHGELSSPWDQDTAAAVTTEFNGKRVRLPGFVVPLDFEGAGVKRFLLVPYVGACIHVPPPPPNQIVYVETPKPYEGAGLFDAVWVTGTFSTMAVATELAEIGYILMADGIAPYDE